MVFKVLFPQSTVHLIRICNLHFLTCILNFHIHNLYKSFTSVSFITLQCDSLLHFQFSLFTQYSHDTFFLLQNCIKQLNFKHCISNIYITHFQFLILTILISYFLILYYDCTHIQHFQFLTKHSHHFFSHSHTLHTI